MTASILFHPQLKAIDAARIALSQGGRLGFGQGRVRIVKAMEHNDRALTATEKGDYDGALQHMRAARNQIDGFCKEGAPCKA